MNDTNQALIKLKNSLNQNVPQQLPAPNHEEFLKDLWDYRDRKEIGAAKFLRETSNTIGMILPGILANTSKYVDVNKTANCAYALLAKHIENENQTVQRYYHHLNDKFDDLINAVIAENNQRETILQQQISENQNLNVEVDELRGKNKALETASDNILQEQRNEINESQGKITELKKTLEKKEFLNARLELQLDEIKTKLTNLIEERQNALKKTYPKLESMESLNLKELQEKYQQLERNYQTQRNNLEEQKILFQELQAFLTIEKEKVQRRDATINGIRVENEAVISNLKASHKIEMNQIRLNLSKLDSEFNERRIKLERKLTRVENQVELLENEKTVGIKGYQELERRLDREKQDYNLLHNAKATLEKELNEIIREQNQEIYQLKKDVYLQSLASVSQGIFRACLPNIVSGAINTSIQMYSGTKFIGVAPACSGFVFIGLVFLAIWESLKRFWSWVRQ